MLSTRDLKVTLTRFPGLSTRARRWYMTARYLLHRPHDYDYAAFALFPQSDGLFLDVGANAGMSSMSLRLYQRKAAILAIEPNPCHAADLEWTCRILRRMQYGIWAAGNHPGEAELFVPSYRGVPITGEASLSREFVLQSPSLRRYLGARMQSSDFEIIRTRVEVRRVDDLDLAPTFVKVDVQGDEQSALEGMANTLDRFGPPVLVEVPSAQTRTFMASLGYGVYVYDRPGNRLVPFCGQPVTNVMFARRVPGIP